MPSVEVRGLTVRYGAGVAPAVDGIDLFAEAGEVLVVLGPNGAGKTSTVETLEGYRRPAAGEVRVLGLDPIADHAALTGRIGVMLQRGGVYPMLGPRRVLDLFGRLLPRPASHPTSCSTSSACARSPPRRGATSRAANSNASPWPWPWSAGPRWRSSTSRPPAWTPRAASQSAPWWPASGPGRLCRPHHARAHRGGEDGRPRRHLVVRPHRARGDAARPDGRDDGDAHRRSSPSGRRPASTPAPWPRPSVPGPSSTETTPGRYRVEADGPADARRHGRRRHLPGRTRRHPHRPRGGQDPRGRLLRGGRSDGSRRTGERSGRADAAPGRAAAGGP